MSFILKALKKLENEKAARKTSPVEIDSAILAPDSRSFAPPRSGGKWIILTLALLAAAGGALFYFTHKTTPPVMEARKTAPQPVPAVLAVPAAPAPLPAPTVQPPVERSVQENARVATPVVQQAPPMEKEPVKRPERVRVQKEFAPRPEPVRQASFVAAPPGLTVSGIALQDDPSESMAVINGALVKTGATVGGAQVDRIYLDRVRFKGNGGTFEVYLSK